MASVNVNPPTIGQITDDPRYNERNGLAVSAPTGQTFWYGTGAPANSLGGVADFYFRTDTPGSANQRIYMKTAAAVWTALAV